MSYYVPALLLDPDVAGNGHRPLASILDDPDRLLRVGLLGFEVGDDHVRALAGERQRHRPADTRVPARYNGDLALQLASTPVGRLAVVRGGLHLGLQTRMLLLLLREIRLRILLDRVLAGVLVVAHCDASVSIV